jgi:hypothetical protein
MQAQPPGQGRLVRYLNWGLQHQKLCRVEEGLKQARAVPLGCRESAAVGRGDHLGDVAVGACLKHEGGGPGSPGGPCRPHSL